MASLKDSCLAHWKLNDNVASTAVADSIGDNDGTAQQNTEDLTATGKIDGGLTFNGTDDYIAITDPSEIDITSAPLSIFAWIYPSVTSPQDGYVICKNLDSLATIQWAMNWEEPGFYITCLFEGAGRGQSAINSVLTGQWSFAGFTWDGTNIKYFVNGSQSGNTATYTGSLTSRANCNIGRRTSLSYFKGSLDNIMIFNVALTQEEITFLYNGGFGTEHLDFPQYRSSDDWSW